MVMVMRLPRIYSDLRGILFCHFNELLRQQWMCCQVVKWVWCDWGLIILIISAVLAELSYDQRYCSSNQWLLQQYNCWLALGWVSRQFCHTGFRLSNYVDLIGWCLEFVWDILPESFKWVSAHVLLKIRTLTTTIHLGMW